MSFHGNSRGLCGDRGGLLKWAGGRQDGHTCVRGSRCRSGCLNESNLSLFARTLSLSRSLVLLLWLVSVCFLLCWRSALQGRAAHAAHPSSLSPSHTLIGIKYHPLLPAGTRQKEPSSLHRSLSFSPLQLYPFIHICLHFHCLKAISHFLN